MEGVFSVSFHSADCPFIFSVSAADFYLLLHELLVILNIQIQFIKTGFDLVAASHVFPQIV